MSCKLCNSNQNIEEVEDNSSTHFQIDFGNCLTGYTEGDFGEKHLKMTAKYKNLK